MADVFRLRVELSGNSVVGPGVATFHAKVTPTSFPASVLAFWTAFQAAIAIGTTVTVPSGGDVLDSNTGLITGAWASTGGGTVSSTSAGNFALGVGARVRWTTSGILRGRRVVGTTFVVPLSQDNFAGAGALTEGFRSGAVSAGNALISSMSGNLVIYSRPAPPPGGIGPDSPGQINTVLLATCPDKVSWLRSRRT